MPASTPAAKSRSSRLWAALESFANSPRATKLKAFSERFEAKPLVEINLGKTANGWALKDVKLSPSFGFKQFTVKTGAAGKPAAPTADAAAPPAGGVQPAAQNGGAPSVAAAQAGGPPQPAPPPPGAAQQSAPPPRSDSP
jgi:hypothetical protein